MPNSTGTVPPVESAILEERGLLAPGVELVLRFDPKTCQVEHLKVPDVPVPRGAVTLGRYRRIRDRLLERVSASLGYNLAVIELDEQGDPRRVQRFVAPKAGRA